MNVLGPEMVKIVLLWLEWTMALAETLGKGFRSLTFQKFRGSGLQEFRLLGVKLQ